MTPARRVGSVVIVAEALAGTSEAVVGIAAEGEAEGTDGARSLERGCLSAIPRLEKPRLAGHNTGMKTTLLLLVPVLVMLASCRGTGGPATRAGRGIDHAVYKVGSGVRKAGQKIENAAR